MVAMATSLASRDRRRRPPVQQTGNDSGNGNDDDLPGQPVLPQGQTTAMTLTTWVACMVTGTMTMTTTDLEP